MNRRESIIRTATELFAEKGYEGVSVREICAAAKTNVAMVNYHFRNKEGLYRECVERLFQNIGAAEAMNSVKTVHDAASWHRAIRSWVEGFSSIIHASNGSKALAGRIYRHEVVHASAMHEFIQLNYARPVRKNLMALLRMTGTSEDDVFRWTASIWSLLSAYVIVDPVWRDEFRPAKTQESKWSECFMDFICNLIFKEFKYHGTAR